MLRRIYIRGLCICRKCENLHGFVNGKPTRSPCDKGWVDATRVSHRVLKVQGHDGWECLQGYEPGGSTIEEECDFSTFTLNVN